MDKPRIQSKTHWAAFALALFGLIGDNFAVLEPFFMGHADVVYQVVALIMAALREFTTAAVSGVINKKDTFRE